jgi:hypothetical protein
MFLVLGLCGLLFCAGLLFFFWYMVKPRLAAWHPALPATLAALLVAAWLLLVLGTAVTAVAVKAARFRFLIAPLNRLSIRWLLPLALKSGSMLGVSIDRITHSFIRVHNALALQAAKPGPADRMLLLLPRCLRKDVMEKAFGMASGFGVTVQVVSGGEMARQAIQDRNPCAVIAAACERDLVSGIRDLCPRLFVLGIPNRRPSGPCKDTWIDLEELRKAIQALCVYPPARSGGIEPDGST